MSSEAPTVRPPRRLLPRIVGAFAVVACLGGSFAVSSYLRPKATKPAEAPAEEAHADAHPEVEPADHRVDRLIHGEQFAEALEHCQSSEEPWLRYRAAVCLERLEDWKAAAERYEGVTHKATATVWANATLGLARCKLAAGDLAAADAAVQEVERLGGAVRAPASHERTRLRACVEYLRLGTPPPPDPFAATALAWPSVVDRRSGEPVWLPPAPEPAAPHDSHAHEPASVPAPTPVPAAPAAETSRDRARDALERVLEEDDHPTVRLTLANFDAQDKAWGKALPAYRQLIEDEPDSPEATLASYNLGLGLLKDGHTAAARTAFLGALDRDPRGKWGELAGYWVGRTYLDGGDPTTALRYLTGTARARNVRAASDLARITCHLLRKDDVNTERETADLRPDATANSAEMHDLFGALLRYRTTPSELRAEQVMDGLRRAHELSDFGPGGAFLAGRIYQELGEDSQMAKLYDAASLELHGPWTVQMTLAAAEYWDSRDRRAEARSRYRAVAAVDPGVFGRRAEQKLAGIALRDGNPRECLARCLRLWKQRPEEPEEVLLLMGRSYERTGQYAAAAACYAGHEPQLD